MANRNLDRGNANPGTIGSDFNRLGVEFWTRVYADYPRNDRRRELLENLSAWRNAIAHQDFEPAKLGEFERYCELVNASDRRPTTKTTYIQHADRFVRWLAGEIARESCDPVSDQRGSKEYKRHVVGVLTERVLARATERARQQRER